MPKIMYDGTPRESFGMGFARGGDDIKNDSRRVMIHPRHGEIVILTIVSVCFISLENMFNIEGITYSRFPSGDKPTSQINIKRKKKQRKKTQTQCIKIHWAGLGVDNYLGSADNSPSPGREIPTLARNVRPFPAVVPTFSVETRFPGQSGTTAFAAGNSFFGRLVSYFFFLFLFFFFLC